MKTKYDWSKVPSDVMYLATNQNGKVSGFVRNVKTPVEIQGLWYGSDYYTGEPKYYNLNIGSFEDWQDSLEERPNEN